MDRITSAIDNTTDQRYSLLDVQYDMGGNITKLKQNGHRDVNATTFGLMDDLTFLYNGNQLKSVDDAVAASAVTGFIEGAENATEYQFDGNGNMVRDDNKKVTAVEYNHLNMPTKITVTGSNAGTLDYVYSADGTKLRKVNSNGTTTDYMNGYIYENGNLVQFFHPEGYVEPDGSGGYTYVYQYRDQIKNVRLSYADLDGNGSINASTEILHERNYFPFGVLHRGYNGSINGAVNNYKQYQSQEYTEDLGLNIHEWKYRFSDPTIGGRFWSIDPLAQEYAYQSPYNFSENRVIDGVELEGAERLSVHTPGWAFATEQPIRNQHPTEGQMNSATAAVIARHPIASSNVGKFERGGTNISTVSARIARHAASNGNMTTKDGSERNALRHATWIATVTSNYGENAAENIGNAHEGIPMGAKNNAHVDFDQPAPDNLKGADSVVDFLNNEIGRQIGAELGEGATEWDAAVAALGVQLNEGLWTATKDKDGNITISRTKITQKQYDTAMKVLSTLNRYGMNSADRKELEKDEQN